MKAEKDSDLEMGMGWRQGQTFHCQAFISFFLLVVYQDI